LKPRHRNAEIIPFKHPSNNREGHRERERDMLCSRMLVPHRNKLLCGMEGRLQLLTFLKKLFYFE
jgi:hypothetical protein